MEAMDLLHYYGGMPSGHMAIMVLMEITATPDITVAVSVKILTWEEIPQKVLLVAIPLPGLQAAAVSEKVVSMFHLKK